MIQVEIPALAETRERGFLFNYLPADVADGTSTSLPVVTS